MKIPKKLKIGKHTIKVFFVEPEPGEHWIGRINRRTLDIELNKEYSQTMQEEAFIHELLHATDMIYGLGLMEHQVTVLGERVYSNFLPLEKED